MPQPQREVVGYQAATKAIHDRVLSFASMVWAGSTGYRDADIDRIVARIVPVVRAGQMQVAMLTAAYISQVAAAAGVSWTGGADPTVPDYRGVPADVVYRRPAVQTYTALSEGAPFEVAIAQGAARLASIVSTDIQQAANRQVQKSLQGAGFRFYRRVLSGSENCALCTVASTQRYNVGNLMPIHPGCDCKVAPLKVNEDPGQVIDSDLLEATHARVQEFAGVSDRGGRGPDYRQLIVTHEHGELGPTLAWRSDKFTGPSDLH